MTELSLKQGPFVSNIQGHTSAVTKLRNTSSRRNRLRS